MRTITMPVIFLSLFWCSTALAQDCVAAPTSATEAEVAILENQCEIITKLGAISNRFTALEDRVNAYHPRATFGIDQGIGNSGYIVFEPPVGTTGGNPCSSDGMQAQSCGSYIENLLEEACWDGRCSPIFTPRIDDNNPAWMNFYQDPAAADFDWSKLSTQMRQAPGALTLNGGAMIFDTDRFLELTEPLEVIQ